jgi:cell division transport system ATP-binding protein
MINFSNVYKRYPGGKEALRGVSFDIEQSEMVFLAGHSGAGKSTLLKLIMQIEKSSNGQVVIAGRNLNRMRRWQIPYHRRQVGVVFQNHQLLFDRSVFENVALPLQIAGFSSKEVTSRVRAALDKVGLLNRENHNPIVLSGGEQQRVGIARAVVNKPPILLADEPTGNLDPKLSAEIMRLFQQFNEVGVTVLIASHDHGLIRRMQKRVLVLNQGEMAFDGIPEMEAPIA